MGSVYIPMSAADGFWQERKISYDTCGQGLLHDFTKKRGRVVSQNLGHNLQLSWY